MTPETAVASGPVTVNLSSPASGGTVPLKLSRSVDQEEVTGNLNDNGSGADETAGDGVFSESLTLEPGQWFGFAEQDDEVASIYVSVEDPAVTVSGAARIQPIEEPATSVILAVPIQASRSLDVLSSVKVTSAGGLIEVGSFSSQQRLEEGAGELTFEIPAEDLARIDGKISVDSMTVTRTDGTPVVSAAALGEFDLNLNQISPELTWIGPEHGPYTNQNAVTLAIESIGRTLDRVEVSTDGGGTWLEAEEPEPVTSLLGRSRIEIQNMEEGEHLIIARSVRDGLAGADHAQTVITVDQTAPTITELDVGGSVTAETAVTVSRKASVETGGVAFETELDGESAGTSPSGTETFELGQGQHLIRVRATDQAGNTGDWAARVLTVDSVAPVVTITGGPGGETEETRPEFTFEVDDSHPDVTLCRFDAAAFEECESLFAPAADLASGQHAFAAKAVDKAGNESEVATRQFTVAEPLTSVLTLSPTSHDFSATRLTRTSSPAAFTITSDGNGEVNIEDIRLVGAHPSDFNLAGRAGCLAEPLDSGESCQVDVSFAPTATGARQATLMVDSDAIGGLSATLGGIGLAAPASAISLGPTSHSFPVTTTGSSSAPVGFVISSTGTAPADLTDINLTGPNAGHFSLAGGAACMATPIEPGDSCQVTIRFSPVVTGSLAAFLRVEAAGHDPVTSALTGQGQAPPAPSVSLTPANVTFPGAKVGDTTAPRIFTISSNGGAAAKITSIAVTGTHSGDFTVTDADSCSNATIPVGGNCQVTVTFSPSVLGARSATLRVTTQGIGDRTSSLSGTGKSQDDPDPDPEPEIELSPGEKVFPDTVLGSTSSAETFRIASTGDAAARIDSITVVGDAAGDFTLSDQNMCLTEINSGDVCEVRVTFAPSVVGPRQATLTVVADGLAPKQALLTGAGLEPPVVLVKQVRLDPTKHGFGQVEVGTEASKAFSVTSIGSDTATVDSISLAGADRAEFKLVDPGSCVEKPLAPAATCSFNVVFAPGSEGEKTAELVVEGDGFSALRSSISGIGKAAPPAGSPRLAIQVKPARLALKGKKPKSIRVTIRNIGDASSQVGKLCLTDPKRLIRKVPCRRLKALAPKQKVTVKLPVRVRKAKRGTRKAKLRIRLTAGTTSLEKRVTVTARR